MKKKKAREYLAECVNEYLLNEFPVNFLTGNGPDDKPDAVQVRKLRKCLVTLKMHRAIQYLPPEGEEKP